MDRFLDGILRTLGELNDDERAWLGAVLFPFVDPEEPAHESR